MSAPLSLGLLVSGRGSNLRALLDVIDGGRLDARAALVISSREGAPAVPLARSRGVPALVLEPSASPSREAYDARVAAALAEAGVELVVLAGFARIVTRALLDRFPDRVVNVHPSLLPAFPGRAAQAQALAHGVRVAGCTVHLVDEGVDSGPILGQRAVPVLDGDDVESLSARILREEHRLLEEVVAAIAHGGIDVERAEGRRAVARLPGLDGARASARPRGRAAEAS